MDSKEAAIVDSKKIAWATATRIGGAAYGIPLKRKPAALVRYLANRCSEHTTQATRKGLFVGNAKGPGEGRS